MNMTPLLLLMILTTAVLVAFLPRRSFEAAGIVAGGLLALVALVLHLGHRYGPGRQGVAPEPDLGPAPADGFRPEAATWYERKHEADERARYRDAYDAGKADAQRERVDRLVGIAGDLARRCSQGRHGHSRSTSRPSAR